MEAPRAVLDLVERFDEHRDYYMSPAYNETQLRCEFLNPLFGALGWDVDNAQNYSEQFRQVVHEDSIRIGGVVKAPDYSFRLGGRRLFFLEAKKPSVNLKENPTSAYQLRRYAWTAKLPVSLLSDFEEFIVYDTRIKPAPGDKASAARVLYIPYTQYADRWGEIASLFSPQAIQKGALDKYVESATKKRCKQMVQRTLDLHKQLQAANTDHERRLLQRQVTATDDESDHLVYELFYLTAEDHAVV
ncbi:MAG: hypothetical protein RBU21_13175, partial [FCB group bacterium]|nr:hypothetical protein [FCB group bacterium]